MSESRIHRFVREENAIPDELWRTPEKTPPPKELFFRGTERALRLLNGLPEQGLAVVGSRRAQPRSIAETRRVIHQLAGTPTIIISGLARGIDSAAHEAALEAGLPTIAVLACGVDIVYPPENLRLRDRILASDGLVASELPLRTESIAWMFIRRNRLIATWSKATWVAAAPVHSGALNTADWAHQLHRDLFSTPCYPGDPSLAGNQRLIESSNATPLWGAHDLGSVWGFLSARNPAVPRPPDPLLRHLGEVTSSQGGATASDLLGWALEIGWTPQEFFERLQRRVTEGWIEERAGMLATCRSHWPNQTKIGTSRKS